MIYIASGKNPAGSGPCDDCYGNGITANGTGGEPWAYWLLAAGESECCYSCWCPDYCEFTTTLDQSLADDPTWTGTDCGGNASRNFFYGANVTDGTNTKAHSLTLRSPVGETKIKSQYLPGKLANAAEENGLGNFTTMSGGGSSRWGEADDPNAEPGWYILCVKDGPTSGDGIPSLVTRVPSGTYLANAPFSCFDPITFTLHSGSDCSDKLPTTITFTPSCPDFEPCPDHPPMMEGMGLLTMGAADEKREEPPPRKASRSWKLGTAVQAALSSVGITEERVSSWLGKPCGCKGRAKKLNALSAWAQRLISGNADASEVEKMME